MLERVAGVSADELDALERDLVIFCAPRAAPSNANTAGATGIAAQ